jgi:hypothetical protein
MTRVRVAEPGVPRLNKRELLRLASTGAGARRNAIRQFSRARRISEVDAARLYDAATPAQRERWRKEAAAAAATD